MALNIDDMRRLLELDQKCRVFWDHGVRSTLLRRRALDKDDKSIDEVVSVYRHTVGTYITYGDSDSR